MAKNELQIRLIVKDELTRALKKAEKQTLSSNKKMQKSFVELAAKVYLFTRAIQAVGRVAKAFIDAADKIEGLGVRLEVLLGSVEEGNRLFADMRDVASQVPQEFDQIMESATTLASVVRGGVEEVNKLMPVILDLSAATGISVMDTTSQMVRMYSAGAASADMFRERGVLAMLGFQAGVSVSAEETMDRVVAAWEDADSKFAGATDKLAETWAGRVSMMSDAWFNFKAEVGKGITEDEGAGSFLEVITDGLNDTTDALKSAGQAGVSIGETIGAVISPAYALLLGYLVDIETTIENTNEFILMGLQNDRIRIGVFLEQAEALEFTNQQLAEMARQFDAINDKQQCTKEKAAELEKESLKVAKAMEKSFSGAFSDIITGAKSAKDAFNDLGKSLIKIIVDFMVQQVVAATIGKALAATATAMALTQAVILAHAWASPAALSSLATLGGNAEPAAAALIATNVLAQRLAVVPAMAEGGIVPATPGGRLIRVGEGGQDEEIRPLSKSTEGITINIYDPRISDESDIDNLAEAMGFQLEEVLRTGRG